MAGAVVLVTDERGRLLLIRRADNGLWALPGGSLEPGESLERTARRELIEEVGLRVGALTLMDVFAGPDLFYEYPNGDQVHNVVAAYRASSTEEPRTIAPDEVLEWGYFAESELPSDVSLPDLPILRAFLNGSR